MAQTNCYSTLISSKENWTMADMVNSRFDFQYWFFGHFHDNRAIDNKHILLWEQIIELLISVHSKAAVWTTYGGFAVCSYSIERTENTMPQPLAYRVVVTTSRGLNIMLTNKREAQLRTYSHFVKQEEARSFADTLQKCLSDADYSDLDRCPICGEAFTRQNRLCRLKDSRIVHRKCFQRAARQGEIPYDNCKEYFFDYFPKDTPEFNFSNLTYEARTNELRYAIQIVSKPVIHLYLIAPGEYIKRHVCFTYEECIGLIMAIRCRLEELRNAAIGHCAHCSAVVYEDKTY